MAKKAETIAAKLNKLFRKSLKADAKKEFDIDLWVTRDSDEAAGYRFTNQHRPILRFNRWHEANAGGFQTFMHTHNYETLYPAEMHLEPGGIFLITGMKIKKLKQEPWDRP